MFLGQLGQPQVGGMHIDQPLLIGRQLPDAAGRQEGQSGPEQGEHREHGQDLVGNPRGPETCHLSSPDTWPAAAHRGACRRTREQDLGSGLEKVRVDSPWRGPGRPLTASAVRAAALRKFGDHASGALNASLCGPGCRCRGGRRVAWLTPARLANAPPPPGRPDPASRSAEPKPAPTPTVWFGLGLGR